MFFDIYTREHKDRLAQETTHEDRVKMLWMWIKQEQIDLREFKILNDYIYSLDKPE